MKNRLLIIITCFLLVTCLTAATVGLIRSNKKDQKPKPPVVPKAVITYEYYLEDVLQEDMPMKEFVLDKDGNETEKPKYEFLKYTCTNDLLGEFDSENWVFNVDSTNVDSTCQLYFANTTYKANITVTNGLAEEEELVVDREGKAEFIITPTEGYTFKEVSCSNNKETKWDESTKTLSIDVITEDVACKVTFDVMELEVITSVNNGEGSTTEKKKYGDKVELLIQPHEGFDNPIIKCSNDQEARFENNKLVIDKLTNSTHCAVEFLKIQPKLYKLTINSLPETATITSGSMEQNIEAGKDAKITIKPGENEELKITCSESIIPNTTNNLEGTVTYSFLSISRDISCDITSTPKAEPPVQETLP